MWCDKAGESMRLSYRVILHTGDEHDAKIAEAYAQAEILGYAPRSALVHRSHMALL